MLMLLSLAGWLAGWLAASIQLLTFLPSRLVLSEGARRNIPIKLRPMWATEMRLEGFS